MKKVIKTNDKASWNLPKPRRFVLVYEKDTGKEHYECSTPIERTRDQFTTYCFGRGVRSFKTSKIRYFGELRVNA